MPGAISNPGGAIPAAGVQNNMNPTPTLAPSANAVIAALQGKTSPNDVGQLIAAALASSGGGGSSSVIDGGSPASSYAGTTPINGGTP